MAVQVNDLPSKGRVSLPRSGDALEKFYIATAIPYVNAPPHIGHALEFVQADVIARYKRLIGEDVYLATGADENSLKNALAAEKLGISTEELCQRNSEAFKALVDSMGISYSAFIRTSIKGDHWKVAQNLWSLCSKNGDIYKKKYKGLYCVGCELFYTENELVDGLCPEHKTKPELVEEENYFFRLSRYQDTLEQLLTSGKIKVTPQFRGNEALGFIKAGLEDFSVSRSVKRAHGWGIPVPGDESQIMYVWFDALAYYLTAAFFFVDEKRFRSLWPVDLHVIGKGITRFHALYWPAMLLSGGLETPKEILVHGYITVEGQKISKSLGNVIDPAALLKRYTSDEIRYYLIRDIPSFDDGDFSEKSLIDRVNKELLGDLGNLVNRVLTLAEKSGLEEFSGERELESGIDIGAVQERFSSLELHVALEITMEFVRKCNAYVNSKEPWKLQGKELESVLYNLLESIRMAAILLSPFIPATSLKISKMLDFNIKGIDDCRFRDSFKGKITRQGYLFRKIE